MTILLFKGFVLGFVFSVAMVSGSFWVVQTTLRGGLGGGISAAAGLLVAEFFWIVGSFALIIGMTSMIDDPLPALRLICFAIFAYMAFKMFRSPDANELQYRGELGSPDWILLRTLTASVTMPFRFSVFFSFMVAASLPARTFDLDSASFVLSGCLAGSLLWSSSQNGLRIMIPG